MQWAFPSNCKYCMCVFFKESHFEVEAAFSPKILQEVEKKDEYLLSLLC